SADQFTLLQGAGFDHALLSFLEIDREGNVNVHHLAKRRHVTAGVGGFADITSRAKSIVFIGAFNAGRRDIALTEGALDIRTDRAEPDVGARLMSTDTTATGTSAGTVELTHSGPVATVTIDRPAKLNALTPELLESLEDAVHRLSRSTARLVVLRTGGARVF